MLVAACTDSPERLWLKAPGWSRAQLVGRTLVSDPVPVALDDVGRAYFLLVAEKDGLAYPRVIALDRRLAQVWDRIYDVPLVQANQPQILWNATGLDLFWISNQELYYASLDPAGTFMGQPALLSGDNRVDSYAVARDADGSTTVWYGGPRQHPGLYALSLEELAEQATLVDAQGIGPDLQYDRAGTLHATWAHYPPGYEDKRLFYAAYPDGVYLPGQGTIVLEPRLGTATTLAGPRLGLDRQEVYLFWSEVSHAGVEAGKVKTSYIHFPRGQPSLVSPAQPLLIPSAYNLTYLPTSGDGLEAGERVALDSRGISSITDLAVNPGQAQELAITFRAHIDYLRRKTQGQISTAFLQDGDAVSYQLLSFTPSDSADPAIIADQTGQLYVTWLEKDASPGSKVFFASTAPEIRGALGTLTWRDLGQLSAETTFGLLGGALLIPLVLVWMLPPLVVVGLTSVIRQEGARFTDLGTLVTLVPAITTYWLTKLLTLPGIRDYVPFSAWLPFIPSWLGALLRWIAPLLFTGLGLLAAWNYTYRRSNPSTLFFVLIFAAVDGVLTVAVYGVLFYGAF
jgi:hypothetical protein